MGVINFERRNMAQKNHELTMEVKKLRLLVPALEWSLSLNEAALRASQEAIERLQAENAALVEALRWYESRARRCRMISAEGDTARHEIDHDGGFIARAALARAESAEGEVK